MLKIAVSLGNRLYDETFSYTKKCIVRHISQLSARNYLVKVRISGVAEDEAWDALMSFVKQMGCDPSKDCLSARSQMTAIYNEAEHSLIEYICVEKDFEDKNQKDTLIKKARAAAWDVKRAQRILMPPYDKNYACETDT